VGVGFEVMNFALDDTSVCWTDDADGAVKKTPKTP
jgi:hypothetical protein